MKSCAEVIIMAIVNLRNNGIICRWEIMGYKATAVIQVSSKHRLPRICHSGVGHQLYFIDMSMAWCKVGCYKWQDDFVSREAQVTSLV